MPAAERNVRGTVWFENERLPLIFTQTLPLAGSSDLSTGERSSSCPTPGPESQTYPRSTPHPSLREVYTQDPWELYEPCATIFCGRHLILASSRNNKRDLVHIQVCAVEQSTIEQWVQMINQLSHRSFLQLLKIIQHDKRYFLVWEPTEFSLHEVLASKCRITESELAQIVWPILKGLRLLRDQRMALGSLTPRDILFTEGGGVKIAGIVNKCQPNMSVADAMTSSADALRLLFNRLVQKNGTDFSWSKDAWGFQSALAAGQSARFLDDLLRHPFFGQMEGEGGLKMLVQLVNKTAYHEIKLRGKSSSGANQLTRTQATEVDKLNNAGFSTLI